MAQQLVQTWVMALVYWKLSRRGGSHGPTDVSSTNASWVSVPLLLFNRHLALQKIVFIWPTGLDLWWAVGSSHQPFFPPKILRMLKGIYCIVWVCVHMPAFIHLAGLIFFSHIHMLFASMTSGLTCLLHAISICYMPNCRTDWSLNTSSFLVQYTDCSSPHCFPQAY